MISEDINHLTNLRYQGFAETPFLWEETLLGIKQFQHTIDTTSYRGLLPSERLRLGNYIERFVSFQLKQDQTIKIIFENLQLIENKQTLGEIDCLIAQNENLYHLEIAYKFYLYKPDAGSSFLECWVGPNLRDSLIQKVTKVKQKQFPLLYSEKGKKVFNKHKLDLTTVNQRCFFKGQLFFPHGFTNLKFEYLNEACIAGFYISMQDFQAFEKSTFYIPKKLDWLIQPIESVKWISYRETVHQIQAFHEKSSAPLIWKKSPKGELEKLFVTWW